MDIFVSAYEEEHAYIEKDDPQEIKNTVPS